MSDLAPLLGRSIAQVQAKRGTATIGASEISAVLGHDPWTSPQDLWERKTGRTVFEGNEATRRGTYFEPALCAWWCDLAKAERLENVYADCGTVLGNGQLQVLHPERRFARATPDIVAVCDPIRGDRALVVCDVKNPASQSVPQVGGGWKKIWETETQAAPLHYQVQSQWQQGVLRAAGIPIVAGELAAGPFFGRLVRVRVDFDPELFALALDLAEDFLSYVNRDEPLPAHFTQQEDAQ